MKSSVVLGTVLVLDVCKDTNLSVYGLMYFCLDVARSLPNEALSKKAR